MSRAETCVMFIPGTARRSSAKFWVGALWIVCWPMTVMVAGALISFSSVRDAETTTVSSYFCCPSGFVSGFGSGFCSGFAAVACGSLAGAGACAAASGADAAHSTAASAKRHTAFISESPPHPGALSRRNTGN
jgi:hypothetical protein